MSIFQFLRILWAHKGLTLATTIATVIGAILAILIVPPSYEAHSRVMLNTMKPDAVTGEILPTTASRTYVATQIELIKDYGVVGQAVDSLGWASNPNYVQQYNRAKSQDVDIRRWLSQLIIDHTDVKALLGTNILEISYRASSAGEAKAMADALRNAYLDASLQTRRREATRTADWYTQQAAQEQAALNAADEAKTAYEKANGIVMQADNTDVDTARLRALSGQGGGAAPLLPPVAPISQSTVELAQLDAAISQASQNLGPNHPQMVAMKARRALLVQMSERDTAATARAIQNMAGAGAGALDRAVAQATSKVIAKRDKIEKLNQLQTEVNLRREEFGKSMERIATLRKEAAIADTGISPLGDAVMPQQPTFPNTPLILGGAVGLGFALGVLLSLLVELFARRIRGSEDLASAVEVPVLAVIATRNVPKTGGGRRPSRIARWPGRRRAAQA